MNISPSRIFYFIQFRRLYKSLSEIDEKIKWSWYLELIKVEDAKQRREIETRIKSGKIKDIKELKRLTE
jgi:hypothetical protein